MLSLAAAWAAAYAQGEVEPIFKATISTAAGVDHVCYSGGLSEVGFDPPSPFSQEFNPLTRQFSVSSVIVPFFDSWIRPIVVAKRLRGKKIEIKIGAQGVSEVDWAPYFSGVINDYRPNGNTVELECLDVFSVLKLRTISGYWILQHPLDVIASILSRANVPAALIDSSSLDPDTAANAPIGHLVVSRWAKSDGSLQVFNGNAFAVCVELATLCNGMVFPSEEGKFTFRAYDATAAVKDTWDSDDISELVQERNSEDVINRVVTNYDNLSTTNVQVTQAGSSVSVQTTQADFSFTKNDTSSQSSHAYPGETSRVFDHVLSTSWLQGGYVMAGAAVSSVATSMSVIGIAGLQLCGFREILPGPQPANAQLSGAKPLYMQFIENGVPTEIIKVTAVASLPAGYTGTATLVSPENGQAATVNNVPLGATLTIVRAQFGTTAAAHPSTAFLIDVTIPEIVSDYIIDRFSDGVSVIKVRTGLNKYHLQLADFVGVQWAEFLGYGMNGLAGTEKWEIIGKEVDLASETPGITWMLASIPAPAPVKTRLGVRTTRDGGRIHDGSMEGMITQAAGLRHAPSGFKMSDIGGLNVRIQSGVGSDTKLRREMIADLDVAILASKDNHFTYDIVGGVVGVRPVTIGAAQPRIGPSEVYLGKVTTGGAAISKINQSKMPTKPIAALQMDLRDQGNDKFTSASRR